MRETAFRNHAESCEEDGAKHHDGAAAENGLRDGREEGPYGREEAAEEHDACACRDGETVHDARERGEANVLAKGCNRCATEKSGNRADKAVAADGATHFDFMNLTFEGAAAKGAGVTDGFRGGHEIDGDDGEDCAQVKFRGEREELGECEKAVVCDAREIDHAHAECENVTDNKADEHGERTEESLRKNLRE